MDGLRVRAFPVFCPVIRHSKFSLLLAVLLLVRLSLSAPSGPRSSQKDYSKTDQTLHHYSRENKLTLLNDKEPRLSRSFSLQDNVKPRFSIGCEACKLIVFTLQQLVQKNASEEDFVLIATRICIDLKIEDERVCTGITREFRDEVVGVLADVVLSPDEACGYLLGDSCAHSYDPLAENWTIPLLDTPKPPYKPPTPPKTGSPLSHFLYVSDIHYDNKYAVGSAAVCDEPLCCREYLGPGSAGLYGSYHCDSPLLLLENLLEHVAKEVKFDFVIFTGDVPAHNVWNQSREDIMEAIETVSNLFKKYLPDVKVYPALGNHESAPVNSFPPEFITGHNSNQWLRDTLAESWGEWLPEDALTTVRKGGFYAVDVRQGLRIISLNTNYCNKGNFWLLINNTDPAGQLLWLRNQLQDAEDKKIKVYLIGHIPPGHNGCLKAWSWTYHKLVNRYANTVRAQIYGHSHTDTLAVSFDETNHSLPISVTYIGPSVTPNGGSDYGLNPAFRVYKIDGDYESSTHAPLDFFTYILNLTAVDKSKQVVWDLEYSAKESYGMDGVYPSNWAHLIDRMETDNSLVQKVHRFKFHSHRPANDTCNASCKKSLICAMKTSRSHDKSQCPELSEDEYQLFKEMRIQEDSC